MDTQGIFPTAYLEFESAAKPAESNGPPAVVAAASTLSAAVSGASSVDAAKIAAVRF